jgi:hypothetical protein
MSALPVSPSVSPYASLMAQIKPDAEGFIDISPALNVAQTNVIGSLKNLLPTKINIDPTFEVQLIKIDSYDIYDTDNLISAVSIQNLSTDTYFKMFNVLTGFPNAQELYRKGVILEDIKINPTLILEDLSIIRESLSKIKSTIDPLADKILQLQYKDTATNSTVAITTLNMNDVNVISDIKIEATPELQNIVKTIDELKIKYNDTTAWLSYSRIENIQTTPGGLAVNNYRGQFVNPKDYALLVSAEAGDNAKYIKLTPSPQVGDERIIQQLSSTTTPPPPPPPPN